MLRSQRLNNFTTHTDLVDEMVYLIFYCNVEELKTCDRILQVKYFKRIIYHTNSTSRHKQFIKPNTAKNTRKFELFDIALQP